MVNLKQECLLFAVNAYHKTLRLQGVLIMGRTTRVRWVGVVTVVCAQEPGSGNKHKQTMMVVFSQDW